MPTFPADPSNFADLLQIVRDGHEIALTPGDYKGPFIIDKSIAIRGTGTNTLIWAVDEPALVVKVPGVRLENLAIERTVGGDTGAVVLSAGGGTSPILNQVKLRGIAPNVQWEGASWDIPAVLDFGEIETNRQLERSWQLQVGAPCEVLWDLPWLQVKNSQLYPGLQNLEVVLNYRDVPAGTNLAGAIFLGATDGIREIAVAGKIKKTSQPTSDAIQDAIQDAINRVSTRGEGSNIIAFTTGEDGLGGLGSEDWGYRFFGDKVIDNHSPVIPALRKGRAESVEEEGLPFLEEKVIGTWRQNTAEDCEKRLAKRWEKVELLWQRQAPDVMIVFGRSKGDRGSYKQWEEENIAPQVVFEILSPGNTVTAMTKKLLFYERYGVEEYYIYDPDTVELTGLLRNGNNLEEIEQINGWVSPRLGIRFVLKEDTLEIYRPDNQRFLTPVELDQLRQQERERAEQERLRAEQERERAEQERLRAEEALCQLEQERALREQEQQRYQALIERLRERGIDPEQV